MRIGKHLFYFYFVFKYIDIYIYIYVFYLFGKGMLYQIVASLGTYIIFISKTIKWCFKKLRLASIKSKNVETHVCIHNL